jgi:hypothetical protein
VTVEWGGVHGGRELWQDVMMMDALPHSIGLRLGIPRRLRTPQDPSVRQEEESAGDFVVHFCVLFSILCPFFHGGITIDAPPPLPFFKN